MDEFEVLAEGYKALSGKAYHASDCATSSAPAMRPGPCDCDCPNIWRDFADRPRDATVLVTVIPGPAHSHPESYVPQTLPAYIDEEGRICDASTWVPDKGLHGDHWQTISWMPLPSPDRNPTGGDAKQGSVEDEGRFPAPNTPSNPLPPLWIWIRK